LSLHVQKPRAKGRPAHRQRYIEEDAAEPLPLFPELL